MQCLSALEMCPGRREPGQCAAWTEQKCQGLQLEEPKAWVLDGGGQTGARNKAHRTAGPAQLEAAAKRRGPAPGRPERRLGPRGWSCRVGGGRGADFRGSAGTSRWVRTYTEIAPSSLTSPRRKTPGRERPPAPRFVFGEEPWDRGAADCGEAPAPSEGTGTGLPGWGAASPALRSTPSLLAPAGINAEQRLHAPAAQWKLTSAGRRVQEELDARLTSPPKGARGKDGSQGRADRARRGRGGGGGTGTRTPAWA